MSDRYFLITGGTGGLGRGVTAVALSQGVIVTIPYVSSSGAERLKAQLAAPDLSRVRFVSAFERRSLSHFLNREP